MVDRYAKFGTEHLATAAARIESMQIAPMPGGHHSDTAAKKQAKKSVVKREGNVIFTSRFPHVVGASE